ncbi:MAG TPA: hypothetical protein VJB36_05715, partial [Methylomirabilota bacterium]|nr:hypothetical protein [Methylomirabilota bacterium]
AILALPGEAVALARRFLADEGPLLASALAFAFVLCVAPLALILLSIAGFLLHSDEVAEYVFDAATLLLPAYGSELAELLQLLAKERAVSGSWGRWPWRCSRASCSP